MNECKHSYDLKSKDISTNHLGVGELLKFYSYASQLSYTSIKLTMWQVNNLDANLSCFLLAIIKKLSIERKIYVFVEIPSHINVLYRNGFFNLVAKKNTENVFDSRESVIPCKEFQTNEDDAFVNYLKRDFFSHRGLQHLSGTKIMALRTAYIEIFNNVELHANIGNLFTCGQYFPESGVLKFTLLDLGQGFLPKISKATNGDVTTDKQAIDWAVLPGHSTKDPKFGSGGYGLQDIMDYCKLNDGSLHIASGGCYWTISGKTNYTYNLSIPFPGSMINLIFRGITK